jgi:Ran GTPase-activating protein (RanGAP) involved in mRNA processing and transport
MKELKELDEYIFSRNRLTDKGFGQLLSTINAEVVKLDFSNNKIHSVDVHLMKILSSKESKLEYLNLENNKLGDAAMSNLSLALSLNKTLRYLNLNKNFLTKISG